MVDSINKRQYDSMNKLIDSIFENQARATVIRIDVGYKDDLERQPDVFDLKNDLKKLNNNIRNNKTVFGDKPKIIRKIEVGEENGKPHAHAIFIFDGHKVANDQYKGMQIADYWNEVITKGRGRAFVCNKEKEKYERCGIGQINYFDHEKRENLTNEVVPYLAKEEQKVELPGKVKFRAFSRSRIVKNEKKRAGRPRSKNS